MIVRLYGTCNGSPVVFTNTGKNLWSVTVPRYASGEYLVQLTAEDEAGNKSHFLDALLAYDLYHLTVSLIERSYKERFLGKRYSARLCKLKYRIKGVNNLKEVFILGEERYVSFEVVPTKSGEEFQILKASWELFIKGEPEAAGDCRIDGHTIAALVCPKTKYNSYELLFTYLIGEETLKTIVKLEVIDPT